MLFRSSASVTLALHFSQCMPAISICKEEPAENSLPSSHFLAEKGRGDDVGGGVAPHDAQAAASDGGEQDDDDEGSHQSELLAKHGEDVVGVGLGEVAPLLAR